MPTNDGGVLARYFALLDERSVDALLDLYAEDGLMITKGGTNGEPVQGKAALRAFYASRGPSTVQHVITAFAESAAASLAEGIVMPKDDGEHKFFLASASLDASGRITRYTTLVWPGVTDDQIAHLTGMKRS